MKAKFLALPLFLVCSTPALAAGKLTCGKWIEDGMVPTRQCVYSASPSGKTLSKKALFNEAFTALGKDWRFAKHIPMNNYRKSFRKGKASLDIRWESANKVSVTECYQPYTDDCISADFERRDNQIIINEYDS